MAISKRKRFEILKRDGFRCRYCGATPGVDGLHVDHIMPQSKGGSDHPDNLMTACSWCNLGKSDVLLSDKMPRQEAPPLSDLERRCIYLRNIWRARCGTDPQFCVESMASQHPMWVMLAAIDFVSDTAEYHPRGQMNRFHSYICLRLIGQSDENIRSRVYA